MSDDRISRYLTDRAAALELRPASVEAVVGRAVRRRRTRRGLVATGVALAVGASAVLVAQRGEPAAEVAINPAAITESPLDWAVVEAASGMSSFRSSSALTDDAVYTLSTAPGSSDDEAWNVPKTLYRSLDGADWAPVALPGDFWASSLAGAGGQLYAVGTSPAGGGSTYRVASSGDGGGTWSTSELPSALGELQARYPGEVSVAPPVIAVRGGTVVVSASLSANLDFAARVPGGIPPDGSLETTEDGVVVGVMACEASPPSRVVADGTDDTDPAAEALDVAKACTGPDPATAQAYTWAQLGVDDELRDLVLHGRTSVYVSQDGGEFTAVDIGDATRLGGQVVAADDGFTLFLTRSSAGVAPPEVVEATTEVLRSADGVTWEPAGELPGYVMTAGSVGGRPALALSDVGGDVSIQLGQADGSWLPVDPGQAVGPDGGIVGSVAFGPLGWAAVVWPETPDGTVPAEQTHVVHSVDGTTMSVVPLADLVGPDQIGSVDASVTADAVVVRVSQPDDGVEGTPPSPQRVVVGTPRG